MAHHHTLTSPLSHLLTLLLVTSHLLLSGVSQRPPADFNSNCVALYDSEVPETREVLYDSNYYENVELSANRWTFISNGADCNNTATFCYDPTNTEDDPLSTANIDLFGLNALGHTDPLYLDVQFTCQACPDCSLSVTVRATNTSRIDGIILNCDSSTSDFLPFEFFENNLASEIFLDFSVNFVGESNNSCVTVNRIQLYYYSRCPSVFNLALFGNDVGPGVLPITTECVENAENSGGSSMYQAECNLTGHWEIFNSMTSPCLCSAGFQPNSNMTACQECPDSTYKPAAGNEVCESCDSPNQVVSGDRTQCVCVEGYVGDTCSECENDYFMFGGDCVGCPGGSIRQMPNMSFCFCEGNRVTSNEESITNNPTISCDTCRDGYRRASEKDILAPCDLCVRDYFMMGGAQCEPCPTNSSGSGGMETSCTCDDGTQTTAGSTTTDGPDCDQCIDGYARNDLDQCVGITVTFSADSYSFDESEGITLQILLEPESASNVVINLNSNDGLVFDETEVTLTASETSITAMTVNDEIGLQGNREFSVTFTTVNSAITVETNTATVSVSDDDEVGVGFSEESYSFSEGDGEGEVTVSLSREVASEVKVQVTGAIVTVTVSDPSGSTLKNFSQQLTFAPGSSDLSETVKLEIVDDSKDETADEEYRLTLVVIEPANSDDITVTRGSASVFITDDDDSDDEAEAFPLAAIVGVCVGGALLAVIAAIICLVCLCLWRVNVNRQGFYTTHEDKPSAPSMLRYSASLRSISSQSVVIAEGKSSTAKENEFFV